MKIIGKSNFDIETVSERLIADGITHEEMGRVMTKALNDKYCCHDNAPIYYLLVNDEHELYRWEP